MLLEAEQDAILTWVAGMNQSDFDTFLFGASRYRLSQFSADTKSMPAIAVDFIGWLERNTAKIPIILDAAVIQVGASEEGPVLMAAADRIRAIQQKVAAAGPPVQARLAGGVPIVNRNVFRGHLQAAIDRANVPGSEVKVIKVRGETGLGRSHSWYLINHVAAFGAARAFKVDLVGATLAQQTVEFLFDYLVRNLGIADAKAPTSEGVTSDTLAARFAEELAGCLGRAAPGWAKPLWLVFDNLDRELRPEIKRFVAMLARARLDNTFDRCVIFLLGPDTATEPEDIYRTTLTDDLVAFLDTEIEDAAMRLNDLGAAKLPPQQLAARIKAMQELRATLRGRELCGQIAAHLVDLRVAVGA